jgi:hypothetical protein
VITLDRVRSFLDSRIPRVGSDAWIEQRTRLWRGQAAELAIALDRYEECHSSEAPCLEDARAAVRASLDAWDARS